MTTRGVYREVIMTFFFNQNTVNMNDPNTVLLIRFCQEHANRATAYEMHPDNLKLMLNGKTLVEPVKPYSTLHLNSLGLFSSFFFSSLHLLDWLIARFS